MDCCHIIAHTTNKTTNWWPPYVRTTYFFIIVRLLSDATSRVQQLHKHRTQTKKVQRQLVTSHDGSTRTFFRPRSQQSGSTPPSLLARQTCRLVRASTITPHVGSHYTPTQQNRLRCFATAPTTRSQGQQTANHRAHLTCSPDNTAGLLE